MESLDSRPRHEESDADARLLLKLAGVLVVLATLVLGVTWVLYRALTPRPQAEAALADRGSPARAQKGPALEISPRSELEKDRTREKELLERYDWVDRASGRVRIPVERAMEMLAEKGLPVRVEENEGR